MFNLDYALFMNEHDVDYETLVVKYSKDNSYDILEIKGDLREDVTDSLKIKVFDKNGLLFEFKVDEIISLNQNMIVAHGKIVFKG